MQASAGLLMRYCYGDSAISSYTLSIMLNLWTQDQTICSSIASKYGVVRPIVYDGATIKHIMHMHDTYITTGIDSHTSIKFQNFSQSYNPSVQCLVLPSL